MLFAATIACCAQQSDSSLIAGGEAALAGVYKLDNVLLAPGQLIELDSANSLFSGVGESVEAAVHSGHLTSAQAAVLQRNDCTLTVSADHTFAITNLPTANFSKVVSVNGTWTIRVYHVFDTYGYRIEFKEPKGELVHTKFLNADKPNPPVLEIFYNEGRKEPVAFRFAKPARH